MTARLPFEILTVIFEQIDDVQDLRHVRATSRTFCAVATPIAFRILSVTGTGGSAYNLGRLFDVPEIATYVREVAYCDIGVDEGKLISLQELKSIRSSAIPELSSSFSRIHQLPQLETINLVFLQAINGPRRWSDDSKGRLTLQASILDSLAESFSTRAAPKLTSLYLRNLRTWDLTPLESTPFQTVLKNLRRLRLSVLYDRAHDPLASLDRWLHFWGTLFHSSVITPTQHYLTELALESSIAVGASSGLSFAGLHFPNLCALSLHNIVFEPSVGVEFFILRHGTTLARLRLITCKLPIDTESSFRPTYWGHIWDSFSAELTALITLHVYESGGDSSGKYVCRSGHLYVRPLSVSYWEMRPPEHLAADDAALRRFYVTVAARSEDAHNTSSGAEGGA